MTTNILSKKDRDLIKSRAFKMSMKDLADNSDLQTKLDLGEMILTGHVVEIADGPVSVVFIWTRLNITIDKWSYESGLVKLVWSKEKTREEADADRNYFIKELRKEEAEIASDSMFEEMGWIVSKPQPDQPPLPA